MIISDIKYAIRTLSKKPGFTLLATFVMAAGIGLSVYLFSFMNTMVFKDLPFERGAQIVEINGSQSGERSMQPINLHDYEEITKQLDGVSEFSAFRNRHVSSGSVNGARRYYATAARSNFFSFSDTLPVLGRTFNELEDKVGAEPVAVLGYDIWQNRYAGRNDVLQQSIKIDGINHKIIGIMPEGYYFPRRTQIWLPLKQNVAQTPRETAMGVYGMVIKEQGVKDEQLDTQLISIMQRLEQRYPKSNSGFSAYTLRVPMSTADGGVAVMYAMHIAALLILILAAVNVGNLLLSRAVERSQETAIRVALGAPRGRLISQLLWESILICGLGGLIGLCLIGWGLEVTEAVTHKFFVDRAPFWWQFSIDAFTINVFLGFLVFTIFVTGFLPAWKSSNGDFNAVLRDGTRGAVGKKAGRLNRILVISQVFLSTVILLVAAMIIVAADKAATADYGVDTSSTMAGQITLASEKYQDPEQRVDFMKKLKANLSNTTLFNEPIMTSALPGFFSMRSRIAIEGRDYGQNEADNYPDVNHIAVMPDSLPALGLHAIKGRNFTQADNVKADKELVIVSESFVEKYLQNEEPIGKQIRILVPNTSQETKATIVGVVKHTIQARPNHQARFRPTIYQPYAHSPRETMLIATRMEAGLLVTSDALGQALQRIDPELPAFNVETYQETLGRSVSPLKFVSGVFSMFGVASLLLSACGIYGVMSNIVQQRSQEVGVKRALGATEQHIIKEFLWQGARQVILGAIPGLVIGLGLCYAMANALGLGLPELIIVPFALVIILVAVVLVATYVPTKKSVLLEPAEALHYQ